MNKKIKILNKDRFRPCTCMNPSYSHNPNPAPGSNETLFIKQVPGL